MKMNRRFLSLFMSLATVFCSIPQAAFADEFGMEEAFFLDIPAVYVVSGKAEKQELAASNVTVITAQQIKERGYRDLKDLLRAVANYDIAYDRDEWVMKSRGISADDNKEFMVLIDGVNMSRLGSQALGEIIEQPNDLSNAKQVEVIRGPGSVFWGTGSLAGVVNIVTKSASDYKKMSEVTAKYGTQKTYGTNFQFASQEPNSEFVLSGSVIKAKGRDIYTDASTGIANYDTSTGFALSPLGRYTTALDRVESGYKLQAKGKRGSLRYNAFGFFTDVYNRQIEINKDRELRFPRDQWFLNFGWDLNFLQDLAVKLDFGTGYSSQRYEAYNYRYTANSTRLPQQGNQERMYMASVDVSKPFFDNKLETRVGVQDLSRTIWENSITGSSTSFVTSYNGGVTTSGTGSATFQRYPNIHDIGVYSAFTYTPVSSLHLTAAGRWDQNIGLGADATVPVPAKKWYFLPRLAAVYEITNKSVIKALYNTGIFRYRDNIRQGLQPEEIKQYELIYIQKAGNFNFTTTGYHQKYYNSTYLVAGQNGSGNNINTRTNIGTELAKGVELEAQGNFGKHSAWLSGYMGRAYLVDAVANPYPVGTPAGNAQADGIRTSKEKGKKLAYPEFGVNAGGTLRLPAGLFVAPMVRHAASQVVRLTPTTQSSIEDPIYETISPQTYVDANFGWNGENLELALYTNNLTNNRRGLPHSIRNGLYQPYGRYAEFRVTLKW